MYALSLILLLCVSQKGQASVTLTGGQYCGTDEEDGQHADPGDMISINCAVDNPDHARNVLVWNISSVQFINLGCKNASKEGFTSIVSSSCNETSSNINATLQFKAVSNLDRTVVECRGAQEDFKDFCKLRIKPISSVESSPIMTSMFSSMIMTMSLTPSSETEAGGLIGGTGAMAGIVIAVFAGFVVIVIVIVIIIYCIVKGNNGGVKPDDNDQDNYAQLEMSDIPKSSKGGSKQKRPIPQPEPVQYSDIKQPKQPNFAELDLVSGKSKKPLNSGVEYSDVRHQ